MKREDSLVEEGSRVLVEQPPKGKVELVFETLSFMYRSAMEDDLQSPITRLISHHAPPTSSSDHG
jgi:hypothetical protein